MRNSLYCRRDSGEAAGPFDGMGWERRPAVEIPTSDMPTLSTEHSPLADGISHWSPESNCPERSNPVSELIDTESMTRMGKNFNSNSKSSANLCPLQALSVSEAR